MVSVGRLAAVAAAVAAVALANYIARKPRDPPVDEQTSDGNHVTAQQSDRHDQVRQSGLGELQDPVVELVPTPPKSAAESPASPNTRRRQQTDVLRPPSRHSSPASMQSSPLTPSNDRTPELGNLCADTDETVVKARPAACRAAPKAGVLPPEPLPEEDVRQRIENDDEVTVGLDCDGEAAGTVEIVVKARPAACRAAPRAGVLTPEPLPEEFFPTHLKTREDLEVLGNDSTGRVEWPKRHQQIEIDDVLLALPANRQCQVQGVPVKVGPNAPSGEFLGSESPSCPHFPLGSHDRNEDVESIVCSGTDDVADNARLSSDPEQIWDDAFFSTLYKKDAEITPRPSPPADTLSTSFYSPATSKPSTKFSSQKLRKGSLGVRIKDVVKNDASCVQVGAILMGGLIWRQGQIESGDLLLKLNGTVIRDCDHLNELMEAVSCTTEDIYMTYQRPPAFALFASRASEQTVVLYKAPKVSPSKESSRWESPPSSEGASLTKSGSDELLPGTTMRSLFPISPTPTIRDTASALKSLQGQHQVTHHTSPAGALVPEMMVFHDSELHSLLDDGNYKDVKGNLLVDTDGLHCADWYHQYMLSDGTCIDLDQRDAVHWYVQAGHEWVPFPVDQSDLLESACRDGYDSVEFSEDILLLLPERKQVRLAFLSLDGLNMS